MEYDVAAFEDVAEGGMQKIEVAGTALLLARVGGVCHAIENGCPHAGGPLDEGVLEGELVTCPWHKAAFSVVTGKHTEPPAVDDVARFAVRVEHGRVLVAINEDEKPSWTSATTPPDGLCFAIVGAGATGAVAAQTLRSNGFTGRIVLIGQEAELPYDRTILSKYTLAGTKGGEKSPLQDGGFYDRWRIERRNATVAKIDHGAREITFSDADRLGYDKALIATGGQPRKLNVEGETLQGVFVLRSAADADAIAAAAAGSKAAIVVGSGFIAMEAAASLRQRGLNITVVAPQKVPFERQLGARIGAVFQRMLEREGVVFRLEQEIAAFEGKHRVETVHLVDGSALEADFVVVGMGIRPATDLLPDVAHREDGGLDVDSRLSVADRLYAGGDIAAFPLRGDRARVRLEHWRVAQQHGRVAALNMLGIDTAFEAIPYFWTTYFTKRLDYVGHAESWDDIEIEGDLDEPNFVAIYTKNAEVIAVAGLGRDKQMASALNLLTKQRRVTLSDLHACLDNVT